MSELVWFDKPEEVKEFITLGIGVWLVSDASKQGAKGTYAWVVADYDDIYCSNTGIVCGCVESVTSYRAEVFGVLSLTTFLWSLFKDDQPNDEKIQIEIHCDNESVVKMSGHPADADADEDVFLQLKQVLSEIAHCVSVTFTHVKGHQKLNESLPREVVLNHWCDGAAKKRAREMPSSGSQTHVHFPAAGVSMSSVGSIGRAVTPWFREALTRPNLQKYFQTKNQWDNSTMALIDWHSFESAHRTLAPNQRTTMVKFRTHWIATRARLFQLNDSPTKTCPCCQEQKETWHHILRCTGLTGLQAEFFVSFQQWMRSHHTPLKLHLLLVNKLRFVLGLTSQDPLLPDASQALRQVYLHQNKIGWEHLFCGFAAYSFQTYIDSHLPTDSDITGEQWVRALLKFTQLWVDKVWQHRCDIEHDKTKETQSATRQHLLHRISTVYKLQHKVAWEFQRCFQFPLANFEQKSDDFLRNWLETHESIISQASQEKHQQTRILEFFG